MGISIRIGTSVASISSQGSIRLIAKEEQAGNYWGAVWKTYQPEGVIKHERTRAPREQETHLPATQMMNA